MRNKQAKTLRKLANLSSCVPLEYDSSYRAKQYHWNGSVLTITPGIPMVLTQECTRYVYLRLKRTYKKMVSNK